MRRCAMTDDPRKVLEEAGVEVPEEVEFFLSNPGVCKMVARPDGGWEYISPQDAAILALARLVARYKSVAHSVAEEPCAALRGQHDSGTKASEDGDRTPES